MWFQHHPIKRAVIVSIKTFGCIYTKLAQFGYSHTILVILDTSEGIDNLNIKRRNHLHEKSARAVNFMIACGKSKRERQPLCRSDNAAMPFLVCIYLHNMAYDWSDWNVCVDYFSALSKSSAFRTMGPIYCRVKRHHMRFVCSERESMQVFTFKVDWPFVRDTLSIWANTI